MESKCKLALVCTGLLWATSAYAATPEVSLNNCQATARKEGRKYVSNAVNAVGICLSAVANDVIKNNVPISAATSSKCVVQFRKLNDTRLPASNKGLRQKLKDKVDFQCDPVVNPLLTHTFMDIQGAGGGTLEDVTTTNINTWCRHYGGDGSIDDVGEWESCISSANDCETASAIAAQFPRASEWLADLLLLANMPSVVPPAADPTRTTDAVAGATALLALLDPDSDGISNVLCGGEGIGCTTGCCYFESTPPAGPETSCVEYTGPAAKVGAFLGSCVGGSVPGGLGFHLTTPIAAPCLFGPAFGIFCGAPPNRHVTPTDSSCP